MSLEARIRVEHDAFVLDAEVAAQTGELLAVLGPNGAGKTTLLRALAGLTPLSTGRIVLDGVVLDDARAGDWVEPEQRAVGVVFQDYCLFPHLSALDNVAFGLRCSGRSREAARREAHAWLARVGLTDRADARPATLSGGEAQRVALARALAIAPRLLLLDEPLAALDVATRAKLRRELRDHLAEFGGARVLVTHDPVDALALADRVVVIEGGRVVQGGTPAELTAAPRSRWVADFAGVNLLRGHADCGRVAVAGGGELTVPEAGRGEVFVVVHPRAVTLHRVRPDTTARNVWQGRIERVDPEGDRARVQVGGVPPIVAEVTAAAVEALGIAAGAPVWVSVKATEIVAYPA